MGRLIGFRYVRLASCVAKRVFPSTASIGLSAFATYSCLAQLQRQPQIR